ncbi:hypothetical protein R3P38DRAFT_2657968 [Favolaschia claudopus]|uniref:F-box domain-containing protein n=1 Tax=Favolaschia claudopus TaxID=2862362 RepID=A0AAV9ZVW7_9AGAR
MNVERKPNLSPRPLPIAGILETGTKSVKRPGGNALQDVGVEENDFSSRIPEEILLHIFRVALPPSWNVYFARTLPPFPQTIWSSDFETKLTIIQVCKRWYRIGLEFLYESVSLNSIGQLAVFVVALESHPHLGSLVRRLEICYWVPRGYHTLHDTELTKALALCPRLTYFAFNPQLVSPSEKPFDISLPKFPPIPTDLDLWEITHLDICDWVPYQSTLPALLYLSSTLQSLSVALPTEYGADHPMLIFPHVHSLRLCISEESVHSGPYWSFPNLQQLLLFPTPRLGNDWPFSSAAKVFLANHGRSLRTLSLGKADENERLKKLLRHCPQLQHLTIAEHWLPSKYHCCHETLQTLHVQRESKRRHCFKKWKTMFPSLRSGHYVDASYDLFPILPAIESVAGQLDYSLPSGSYLEFLHIVRDDPEYQPVVTQSDLDDSDTSDSETDSDSSYSDSPSIEGGDEWEIEREEAIEIFRKLILKRE